MLKKYVLNYKEFVNENMFVDKVGRLRSDSDSEEEFKHSPTTERKLMFIEDYFKADNVDRSWFNYMLIDKYNFEMTTEDVYTELALAIRDGIIPETDIEEMLEVIEDKISKKV